MRGEDWTPLTKPDSKLKKKPHTKAGKFKLIHGLNPHSNIGGRLGNVWANL